MITQSSHFVNDIFIPQTGHNVSHVANDNNKLKNAIAEYEVEILVKGLGRKMTNALYASLNHGQVVETTDQIYKDLVNGVEYTYNDKDFFWRGLVEKIGGNTRCMMAYFVYWNYVKNSDILLTTMGAKKGKSNNTVIRTSHPKLVTAWRNLYEWYMGDCEQNVERYYHKGHYVEDYFNGHSDNVSMYQFLSHNRESYPDWKFTSIDNKNMFDI